MFENQFFVVARKYVNGIKAESVVDTFDSEEIAFYCAEKCDRQTSYLMVQYGEIRKVPIETEIIFKGEPEDEYLMNDLNRKVLLKDELIDKNYMNYRNWPTYFVKAVVFRDICPCPGENKFEHVQIPEVYKTYNKNFTKI